MCSSDLYDVSNPVVNLRLCASSCFFGEPQYYRTDKEGKLKTGKNMPQSHLQLEMYAYGLRKEFGLHVTKGHYWMARRGELSPAFDLAGLTDSKVEALVDMFDRARKSGIFLPNFDHCNMCGYSASCEWYTPKEKHE